MMSLALTASSNARSCDRLFARLGCGVSLALLAMLPPASAQEAVPSINVETDGATAGAGGEAAAANRPDLAPDSPANISRVAPSSRPHVETFTKQDIEALHPSDPFDLLKHATGVVVTFQGRKLPYNLLIRGDSNFGFIIDGAYVTSAAAGRMLQTLPIQAIEQMKIVRDPTALTLGPLVDFGSPSGALNSGFIVINTHNPAKTEGEFYSAGESFGTFRGGLYGGTTFALGDNGVKGFASGYVNGRRSDGPTDWNASSHDVSALLKGGIETGVAQSQFTFFYDSDNFDFQRATAGQNSASLVAQRWSYAPIDTTLITSQTTFTWDPHNTTVLIGAYQGAKASNVQASYANATVTTTPDASDTAQVHLRHSFNYWDTLAQLGLQYVWWNTPTGELFYSGYARREETLSGYANIERKFFDDRLDLDASIRFDDHTIDKGIDLYNQGAGSGGGGINAAKYKYFYDRTLPLATNYAFGAAYKILPQLVSGLRYSHTEQGGLTNVLSATGKPLSGESQNKFEASLAAPVQDWLRPTATYFYTHIGNDKTPTSYKAVNGYQTALWTQSDTLRQGFELAGEGDLPPWALGALSYRSSWTHLMQLASSVASTNYSNLIPHDQASFTLTNTWNAFSASASLIYVSKFLSNFNAADGKYHEVGNFVTADINLGYKFHLQDYDAKLTLYGRNIADRRYQMIYGYYNWGAVYGAEVKVAF
ncbi:hypothetical protein CH337_20670 [Rhodoblastus acidophilus]|nr:hypothetical protein CKO16_20850 [Rhodoblastus acidophilus]RAI16569.1 hypothetical protein CH337_20670 [Rhodoblastus acidophilus]